MNQIEKMFKETEAQKESRRKADALTSGSSILTSKEVKLLLLKIHKKVTIPCTCQYWGARGWDTTPTVRWVNIEKLINHLSSGGKLSQRSWEKILLVVEKKTRLHREFQKFLPRREVYNYYGTPVGTKPADVIGWVRSHL